MTKNDRVALELAIEHARRESPGRAQQLDNMLHHDPWTEVATFAAYCCQCRALGLKSWQYPPCWCIEAEHEHSQDPDLRQAAKLLREMLELGISKYAPDPLAAIAEAKRKAKAPAE